MYLVHQRKDREGKWEVAWMWLPHFLAADETLHKHVDQKMTEKFKGERVEEAALPELIGRMHQEVVNLLLEKYPIPGLRRFLDGYTHLRPGEEQAP
jgi:hypothetical protein